MTERRGGESFDFNVFSAGPTQASLQGATFHSGPVPQAVSTLPASPLGFTGRAAELSRLLDVLDPAATTSLPVCAVFGPGGIGKTALVLQAAHQAMARGWFAGGALFVDLRGYDEPVTADQAVAALLSALGVRGRDMPSGPLSQFALYRSLLATVSDPVLVILDNASDVRQVAPLLPGTENHRVLVTSRDRLVELEALLVDLGQLGPKEAAALLTEALRLRNPDDPRPAEEPEALNELALLCGHLPLALSISVAELAERPHRTIASLVRELKAPQNRDFMGLLRQVFRSSYQRLAPEPARVLRLLALAPTAETGTEAAAAMIGLSVGETALLLGRLREASLMVSVRGSRGEERWRFHNPVRDQATSLTPPDDEEGREARRRVLAFYAERSQAALDWLDDRPAGGHGGFDDREHALAWLDEERPNLVAAAGWVEDEQYASMAQVIGMSVTSYLIDNGHLDDALSVSRTMQFAAHHRGDGDDEARAWGSLGVVLGHMGRAVESVEAFGRACQLFQAVGNLRSEAVSWDNLGISLHEVGRTEEAVDAHARARDLYATTGDRFREAGAWNNLGIALRDMRRWEEATNAFARARDFMRETGHAVGEADVWNNLGITLRRLERTPEAVEAFTRAIELRRNLGDSYGEGRALRNLAIALGSIDDSAARGYWEQAAEAFERVDAVTEAARARSQAEGIR
ncbi:tetratricopeptide repeat protein [Streptomyces prunicolor]|uniref:tetratricopeptide repeat protein n=1 Tax=Streptomyces prunicolor TaxID=67348 RepID=UPI0034346428